MALRKIIKMPNSFLRKKASAVNTIDNDIKHILDDMLETMYNACLLYTSPSPRDQRGSRMPSSA